MPLYEYKALKSGREIVTGLLEASSSKEARESLRKMNLQPVSLSEQKETGGKKSTGVATAGNSKTTRQIDKSKPIPVSNISIRDKIDFTNTLSIFVKTGISLVEGLLFIELHTYNPKVQNLAAELRRQIFSGTNLSSAVLKYPKIFDVVYYGLVRAGEESGQLDTILQRLVVLLKKQESIKSKVIGTMIYPCFIMILAGGVVLVMLTFVFPAFKDMYDQMGQKLPLITSICMDTGLFLKTYWFSIPLLIGSIVYSFYLSLTWAPFIRVVDKISLSIPVVSDFVKYAALSNFLNVFKVSFDAGVPILDCLLLSNQTVKNVILKEAMKDAGIKIQNGQSLSNSLKNTGLIPGIIMCLIMSGEESGQLSFTMEQAAEYVENELDRVIDILNKLTEPAMIVIIGGIVLVLALALYLPLFQSYSNMI